jgi:hypothetical protein
MKTFKFEVTLLLLFIVHVDMFSQGINNLWTMGYGGPQATLPFGGIDMNFINGNPSITYVTRDMEFRRAVSTICDSSGNLLFVTNGVYVADATGDTMQNGSGLNPSAYTTMYPDGLPPHQMNIIIPVPSSSNLYYLFHCTIDDPYTSLLTKNLYYSIIDISQNFGLGSVIAKNQILITDSLNLGRLAACKHANGRDWWLICHKAYNNIYKKFLITPYGINGPFDQSIGVYRIRDVGQSAFSFNGNHFAYYGLDEDLDIFNFDRCSGLLSNHTYVALNDSATGPGLAFSNDGKYLYVSSTKYVYQFDVTSTNIPSTQTTVAVWNSFYSPNPPLGTFFNISQLAPDGKIYIGTGNATLHLHVINQPDSAGLACDLVQHGIALPAFNFNSLPNHPNYFLGNLPGSPCDTLTGVQSHSHDPPLIKAYPNPVTGPVTFQFPVKDHAGTLQVIDATGKLVYSESIASWSQFKKTDLSLLSPGLYQCLFRWNNGMASIKLVREP